MSPYLFLKGYSMERLEKSPESWARTQPKIVISLQASTAKIWKLLGVVLCGIVAEIVNSPLCDKI